MHNKENIETGILGEQIAIKHLAKLDYHLLHKNWRFHNYEIDIIAENFGEIVFVEVKTRSSEALYTALKAVNAIKQKNIKKAALAYLKINCLQNIPFRFDVITIVGKQSPYSITHYKNAFFLREYM